MLEVARIVDTMEPISLAEIDSVAALRTRVDRKYVVDPGALASVVATIAGGARALTIDDRRTFSYESVYFDTPALDSYMGSARRRRTRFKVRTRTYLDSDECALEVKQRDRRGQTVKHRVEHATHDRHRVTDDSLAFLAGFEILSPIRESLRPSLVTAYDRSTLLLGTSRATIDVGLRCRLPEGDATAGVGRFVVVETKTTGSPCALDRALWSAGIRPTVISKYGSGLAALRPELPSNKWHRTLRRHVCVRAATL